MLTQHSHFWHPFFLTFWSQLLLAVERETSSKPHLSSLWWHFLTGKLGHKSLIVFSTGERKGQPTPLFLPGRFHGQRSLAGYSPWGHKESDMTEHPRGCFCLFVFYILDRQIVYFQVICYQSFSDPVSLGADHCETSTCCHQALDSAQSCGMPGWLHHRLSLALGLLRYDWPLRLPSFCWLWNASFFRTSDAVKQVTWSCAFSNSRFQLS